MLRVVAAAFFVVSLAVSSWAGSADDADDGPGGLYQLSIEELMEIEVTSVSRRPERLSETAAAVFVITAEDIRRSGFTSIAEALRMVPGLEVARIDASKWSVASRGFSGRLASKLLVLIDGRSVYTPLFSGVFWNRQDVLLEDISRIEVIRGPGATLWGANAVNGVINIITKGADETCSVIGSIGGGSEERGFGNFRYGARIGDATFYRVYAKYLDRDDSVYPSGARATDGWWDLRSGFRVDSGLDGGDHLTIQGDVYGSRLGETFTRGDRSSPLYVEIVENQAEVFGVNLLGRWKHVSEGSSEMTLQMYLDRATHSSEFVVHTDRMFDVDCEHQIIIGGRQELIWGLGYRLVDSRTDATLNTWFEPEDRRVNIFSAFVQDNIGLAVDRLRLTVGSKFEHNGYTEYEIQPNVRLLWTPGPRHTAWAAVSRAVRTPSRADRDVNLAAELIPAGVLFPDTLYTQSIITANQDFVSERLVAYEFGYRIHPVGAVSLDFAAFHNRYDDLLTVEQGLPYIEMSPEPHYVLPMVIANKMSGYTYGFELASEWELHRYWRLRLGYTYLKMELTPDDTSTDVLSEAAEGQSPRHQFCLYSRMDLPREVEVDFGFRYVDELPNLGLDSYSSLDARIGLNCLGPVGISVVGQNLLESRHTEMTSLYLDSVPTEIERGVYAMIRFRK
ncbi:MAG: TonB-dependent receptor [Candidatus Eisenbacteria bacterium]